MLLFALSPAACLINTALYEERLEALTDADGDGFAAEDDCDDADPAVFPGAVELCNGIDDDCDGSVDEDASDALTWYIDGDGDGFGTSTATTASCTAPAGYVLTGDDCDDTRADVHPGATDVPYNGIDEDCQGGDLVDMDGDGEAALRVGGGDCDDDDATVYPGAEEVCFDGIDQDCDGLDLSDCDGDGFDAFEAGGDDCDDEDASVYPGADEGWHDMGVDNDCDGSIEDPVTLSLGDADRTVEAPAAGIQLGRSVGTLPDVDGDGTPELWMGAPYDDSGAVLGGSVYMLPGADLMATSGTTLVEGVRQVSGQTDYEFLTPLASASLAEVSEAVVLVNTWDGGDYRGVTYAILGSDLMAATGGGAADLAVASFTGVAGDYCGTALVAGRDLDGDGVADLLLMAPGSGRVYAFLEASRGEFDAEDASFTWAPSRPGELTVSVPGDATGDGVDDVGLTFSDDDESNANSLLLEGGTSLRGGTFGDSYFYGLLGNPVFQTVYEFDGHRAVLTTAFGSSAIFDPEQGATYHPDDDADLHLYRVAGEGAFTRTAHSDWFGDLGALALFSAPTHPDGDESGECLLWRDDEMGADAFAADQPFRVAGEHPGDRACSGFAVDADFDGNGMPDLVIGAPGVDGAGDASGRVYVEFDP